MLGIEKSKDPKDWAPLIEKITWQIMYRQLGIVSIPIGIDITSQAIDILCKEKGMGSWEWLLEGRVLLWKDIPIDKAMKVYCYVYGSKLRQKNSVFTRVGFWRMYFFELSLKTLNLILTKRIR
jgi:hypothetical protein